MAAAVILVEQASKPPGVAGKSRDDLDTGLLVTLTNDDDTGVTTWRWQLVDKPGTSTISLSSTSTATTTFTPDVEGSYLIKLTVNAGDGAGETDRILAVVRDGSGFRIPAFKETTEANWDIGGSPNERGWWPDIELLFGSVSSANSALDWKQSVRAATTAALPANSRSGSTLTADANGALVAQDGVSLVAGNRLVVKDEATGAHNGFYQVTQLGDGSNPWILDRTTDADADAKVTSGSTAFIEEGATNGGQLAFLTTVNPIVLNTTALVISVVPITIEPLAATLAAGNTTGGNDIELSSGDSLVSATGTDLTLAPATGRDAIITTDLVVGRASALHATALNVLGDSIAAVFLDIDTDAADKNTRIATGHYTNAEEPVALIYANTSLNLNVVNFGGGTSLMNAATHLRFFTAADNVTTTGTQRGEIASTGAWTIGAAGVSVDHSVWGSGLAFANVSTDTTNKVFNLFGRPYTNADGIWSAIYLQGDSSNNVVRLGGLATADSATQVEFYTATALNTSGTLRGTITSSGAWNIGAADGSGAHFVNGPSMTFRDVTTDATDKSFLLRGRPYANSQGEWTLLRYFSDSGQNYLDIGGASASDSSTQVRFYTATALDTTGTLRGSMNNAGLFSWLGALKAGGAALDVADMEFVSTTGLMMLSDSETNATAKFSRFGIVHYTNAEEPFIGVLHEANVALNQLSLGGGTSLGNAASNLRFFTAADNTTPTGTERGSISSSGIWTVGAASVGVNHNMWGAGLTAADVNTDTTNKNFHLRAQPYTNTDGSWAAVQLRATSTANVLRLGGNTTDDAATLVELYTATALNTAGTLRGSITNAGLFNWLGDFALDSGSPIATFGDDSASPTARFRKSAGGTSQVQFLRAATAAANDKRNVHDTDETWKVQHHDGGGWTAALEVDNNADVLVENQLLMVGATATDASADADDGIVGDGATNVGWTFNVGAANSGRLAWNNATNDEHLAIIGSGNDFNIRVNNVNTYSVQAGVLRPLVASIDLGNATRPWDNIWGNALFNIETATPPTTAATQGAWWTRNDTPNTAMFTDDAGGDHPLSLMELVTGEARGAMIPSAAGATKNEAASGIGQRSVISFSPTADQEAYWIFTMPRDYTGDGFTVRLRYSGNTAFGAGDSIDWNVGVERHVDDLSMTAITTTDTAGNDTPGVAYIADDLRFFDIAVTGANDGGIVGGDAFLLKVERLGSTGGDDDYADSAHLFSVSITQDP